MRKQLIGQKPAPTIKENQWLDLEKIARVEISSEDCAHPIEGALSPDKGSGWRAGQPGEQKIRMFFDTPHQIKHIFLQFEESERQRTQELVLRWSSDQGANWFEITRQQYNFSPTGTTSEVENYQVDLSGVTALELEIKPDIGGSPVYATLSCMRLA